MMVFPPTGGRGSGEGGGGAIRLLTARATPKRGGALFPTSLLPLFQNDKVSKAVANFESAVREIDVRLSVAGGDAGKGARAQRAEVGRRGRRGVPPVPLGLPLAAGPRPRPRDGAGRAGRDRTRDPFFLLLSFQVTIYTHRHGVVRVEDVETSAYAAVDVVCDKVRGKLRRVKEKAIARGRWPGGGGPRGERVAESVEFSTDDESGDEWTGGAGAALPVEDETVVREKAFTAERMTASAAIEAAVQLGHDFYVYADDAAGGLRVVYKRRGGGYGVLVPTAAARE